jgi:hypothetical protein
MRLRNAKAIAAQVEIEQTDQFDVVVDQQDMGSIQYGHGRHDNCGRDPATSIYPDLRCPGKTCRAPAISYTFMIINGFFINKTRSHPPLTEKCHATGFPAAARVAKP